METEKHIAPDDSPVDFRFLDPSYQQPNFLVPLMRPVQQLLKLTISALDCNSERFIRKQMAAISGKVSRLGCGGGAIWKSAGVVEVNISNQLIEGLTSPGIPKRFHFPAISSRIWKTRDVSELFVTLATKQHPETDFITRRSNH